MIWPIFRKWKMIVFFKRNFTKNLTLRWRIRLFLLFKIFLPIDEKFRKRINRMEFQRMNTFEHKHFDISHKTESRDRISQNSVSRNFFCPIFPKNRILNHRKNGFCRSRSRIENDTTFHFSMLGNDIRNRSSQRMSRNPFLLSRVFHIHSIEKIQRFFHSRIHRINSKNDLNIANQIFRIFKIRSSITNHHSWFWKMSINRMTQSIKFFIKFPVSYHSFTSFGSFITFLNESYHLIIKFLNNIFVKGLISENFRIDIDCLIDQFLRKRDFFRFFILLWNKRFYHYAWVTRDKKGEVWRNCKVFWVNSAFSSSVKGLSFLRKVLESLWIVW